MATWLCDHMHRTLEVKDIKHGNAALARSTTSRQCPRQVAIPLRQLNGTRLSDDVSLYTELSAALEFGLPEFRRGRSAWSSNCRSVWSSNCLIVRIRNILI